MNSSADELVEVECRPCLECGQAAKVTMTRRQVEVLAAPDRPHVQDIFPDWSDEDRELLITGTHPTCWDVLVGVEDDEW